MARLVNDRANRLTSRPNRSRRPQLQMRRAGGDAGDVRLSWTLGAWRFMTALRFPRARSARISSAAPPLARSPRRARRRSRRRARETATTTRPNGARATRPRTASRSAARRRRCSRRQTVAATEAAIQTYQSIVARGGWNAVPTGAELRVGVKSKAVQALAPAARSPRAISIRSPAWARPSTPSSRRRSSASRCATGSARTASSTRRRSPNSTCPPRRACSSLRPTSCACAPFPAISASAS